MSLEEKIKQFNQKFIYNKTSGLSTEEDFTQYCFRNLKETRFGFAPVLSYYESPDGKYKVNGYDFHDNDKTVDIYITDVDTINYDREFIMDDLWENASKLFWFLQEVDQGDLVQIIPEYDNIYPLVKTITENGLNDMKIDLIILTNRRLETKDRHNLARQHYNDYNVWVIYIEELLKNEVEENFMDKEVIDLNKDFNRPLPCIKLPTGISDSYESYLTFIPANILAQLYKKYSFKLLEANVRAYLTGRSKVNQGILNTLKEEPEMFFAYNNGLSTICTDLEIEYLEGKQQIISISGMQIVNGGQTTASLFEMLKILEKSKIHDCSFEKAYVQMKINVIKDKYRKKEIIRNISTYANTQNKVAKSDLSTNEEFNMILEKQFKNTWFETGNGNKIRWYYERYKGQYVNERSFSNNVKEFDDKNPKSRKITKTDLAKTLLAWHQYPNLVVAGAEKSYEKFSEVMLSNSENLKIDDLKLRRYVALILLQKEIDVISKNLGHGSLKATTVAYTLAILSKETDQRLDLDRIWRDNGIDLELRQRLVELSKKVFDELQVMPTGSTHVQMWARKPRCWNRLSNLEYNLGLSSNWLVYSSYQLLNFDTTEIDLVETYDWVTLRRQSGNMRGLTESDKQTIKSLAYQQQSDKSFSLKQKLSGKKMIEKMRSLDVMV